MKWSDFLYFWLVNIKLVNLRVILSLCDVKGAVCKVVGNMNTLYRYTPGFKGYNMRLFNIRYCLVEKMSEVSGMEMNLCFVHKVYGSPMYSITIVTWPFVYWASSYCKKISMVVEKSILIINFVNQNCLNNLTA